MPFKFPSSLARIVLRQLCLPLRGAGRGVRDYHGPDRETSPLAMPPTAHHVWTLIRTLRVPPPAAGPNWVLRAASRPRELRDNAPRHRRPRDHSGTAGCGRADGATRRCSTSRAHPAVLTQRGLRAGSTWEPRGASGRVDHVGSTGREPLSASAGAAGGAPPPD